MITAALGCDGAAPVMFKLRAFEYGWGGFGRMLPPIRLTRPFIRSKCVASRQLRDDAPPRRMLHPLKKDREAGSVGAASSESVHPDLGRIGESRGRTLLFVLHTSPFSPHGGAEFHVRDLVEALALDRVVVAYPAGRELVAAEVFRGDVKAPVFYSFALSRSPDLVCIDNPEITRLVQHWIELFGISGCHIHHLKSLPISLGRVLSQANIPYLYSSHDYYAVCPNWNLFDYDLDRGCECRWEEKLNAGCLPAFTHRVGPLSSMDLTALRYAHRQAFREFISSAAAVVFPSEAARRRVLEAIPVEQGRTQVVEHGTDIRLRAERLPPGTNLRVAAVGGVAGPLKGNRNYRELVLRTRDLPVEWHFFGADKLPGLEEKRFDPRKVRFHERYRRDQIADLLAGQGIDLCVILPSSDETFSYVLSEAWAAGIPVLVNGKGALSERVNNVGAGVVVNSIDQAFQWLQRFCSDRADIQALAEKARAVSQPSNAQNAEVYLRLYRTTDALGAETKREPLKEGELLELVARKVAVDPGLPAHEAAPEYQSSGWYPNFLAIKRYIPSPARQVVRKVLLIGERIRRNRKQTVINFQHRLQDLRVLRRRRRTVAFESTSANPRVVFEVKPFRPEAVRRMQFELRLRSSSHSIARLLWVHSFDEPFSVKKSVMIELKNDGKWHRYLVDIEDDLKASWERGTEIARLCFEPVNERARFEVKPLTLGNFLLRF